MMKANEAGVAGDRRRTPVVDVQNLCKDFVNVAGVRVNALRDVSMRVGAGEFVCILGRSGSGKTSLLHVLGTIAGASSGTVRLFGEDVSGLTDDRLSAIRSWSIGFVFQSFCLIEGMSAIDNVASALVYRGWGAGSGFA